MGKRKNKKSFCSKLDVFGTPITLIHQGEKKFNTGAGGLLTVIVFCGIFAFFIDGLIKINNEQLLTHTTMATVTRKGGRQRFPSGVDIATRQFNMFFGFNQPLPSSIGSLEVQHVVRTRGKDGYRSATKTSLEFSECEEEDVASWADSTAQSEWLQQLQCINLGDLPYENRFVGGHFYDSQFQYLKVSFQPCSNRDSPDCKPYEEIDQWLRRSSGLNFVHTESVLDLEAPASKIVQPYLHEEPSLQLEVGKHRSANVFMQPGDVVHQQSKQIMGQYFKSRTERLEPRDSEDGPLGTFYVRLDDLQEYSEYVEFQEKSNVSLVGLVAQVGGLSWFVFVIGLTFTEMLSRKLFIVDLVCQLFIVPKHFPNWKKASVSPVPQFSLSTLKAAKDVSVDQHLNLRVQQESTSNGAAAPVAPQQPRGEIKDLLFKIFANNKYFAFGAQDLIFYFLQCVSCRSRKSSFFKNSSNAKQHLFAKGERKINSQLEVVHLMQSVRRSELLFKNVLTTQQQVLMNLQKDHKISWNLSSSEQESQGYRVAKNRNLVYDLAHPKPRVSIFTMGRINKVLKTYNDPNMQLSDLDRKLLKGVMEMKSSKFLIDDPQIVLKRCQEPSLSYEKSCVEIENTPTVVKPTAEPQDIRLRDNSTTNDLLIQE